MKLVSLLKRFTLISSFLIFAFSLTVAGVCLYIFWRSFQEERYKDIESSIHSESVTFQSYFANLNELAALITSRTRLRQITEGMAGGAASEEATEEAGRILEDALAGSRNIAGICRILKDGSVLASAGMPPPAELRPPGDLRETVSCILAVGGRPHIVTLSPVLSSQKELIACDIIVVDRAGIRQMAESFVSKSSIFNSISFMAVGREMQKGLEIYSVNTPRDSSRIKEMFFDGNFKDEVTELPEGMLKSIRTGGGCFFLCPVYTGSLCRIYAMTSVNEDFFSVFSDQKIYMIILLAISLSLVSYVILSEFLKPLEKRMAVDIERIFSLNQKLSKEIKNHQQTEQLLKRSELKFRTFMDNIPGMVFIKDSLGRYAYMNNFLSKTGLDDHERWIGKTDAELWPEKHASDASKYDRKILSQSRNFNTIDEISFRNSVRRFITYRFPMLAEDEQTYVGGISMDITDVLRMEDELAREKERLSLTLHSISDGVIVTDRDWKIRIINKSASEITGWDRDEADGKEINEVLRLSSRSDGIPIKAGEILKHIKSSPMSEKLTFELATKSGTKKVVEDGMSEILDGEGACIGFVVVVRDITLISQIQENLRTAQKMESIGLLAGGIAHDFNNILMGITGNLSMARMMTMDNRELDELLSDAEQSADRAKELTKRLITFAKGGSPEVSVCPTRELVSENIKFNLVGSNVRRTEDMPQDIWAVRADPSQLSQVFSNIITNAKQAMPDGGDLDVAARNIMLGPDNDRKLPPGPYVKISFKNNGENLRNEIKDKIFDPYFTTRKGFSGLGLSIAFSIVRQHGGFISVEDNVPRGVIFHVILPSTGAPAPETKGDEEAVESETPGKFTSKKILVMDDDEAIRKFTMNILSRAGHMVRTACNGEQAVSIFKEAAASDFKFNIVILDLTIVGGMGGKETLQQLKSIDPDVTAVVSSGYSEDSLMAEPEKYGFKYRLPKPYSMQQMIRLVNSIPASPTSV